MSSSLSAVLPPVESAATYW